MKAYYNEFDKKTSAWLRELIKAKLIMEGDVDERSIKEVQPNDLRGYTRCHFFAGIGGWDYALRLAGWSASQPVWSGSCPCQPFSSAGKQKGVEDERHLWPAFFRLIRECRPVTVFGEQVAGSVRYGWLDGVFSDLESADYTCGAAVLGAHSVGAPHLRQRLYWVAGIGSDSFCLRLQGKRKTTQKPWTRQQFEGLVQTALQSALPSGKSGGVSDGLPARVVRLRGYGNAICPQTAQAFIEAFMEGMK